MKTKFGIFVILFCFGMLNSNAQIDVKFIETVQRYQDSVKLIYNRELGQYIINENTFNLNHYLKLFEKLEFNQNLEFDYIYFDNGGDGNPYLYAKEKSFDLDKYLTNKVKEGKIEIDKREIFLLKTLYNFLNDSVNKIGRAHV